MKTRITILLGLVLIAGPVSLFSRSLEGYAVHDIRITGNKALSAGELADLMTLRGTGVIKRSILLRKPMQFRGRDAESDLLELVRYYQREGYLYASAAITDTIANDSDSTLSYTITIDEGPATPVGGVGFVIDNPARSDSARLDSILQDLQPVLKLENGNRFRDASVYSDQLTLTNGFRNSGYPYFRCEPRITIETDSQSAVVEWLLHPGPYSRFETISVSGNDRVSTGLLLKQVAFRTGDRFSRDALDDTQGRIYGLGMFRRVTVDAVLSENQDTLVPVHILVKEASPLSVRFGGGYGKEERIRTVAEAEWLGATGGARRLNLELRHSHLEPYGVDLRLTEPYFFTHQLAAKVEIYGRSEHEPGYKITRAGLDNSYYWRLNNDIIISAGYVMQRVDKEGDDGAGEIWEEITLDSLYNISGPHFGFTFDNSAPLFKPNRGVVLSGFYKINGALLSASDYRFTRLLLEFRHYRPMLGSILALRLKMGRIISKNEGGVVPVEERFFAGGTGSVRGWSRQQLGPKDVTGKPVGGKSLFEGSAELRFTLIPRVWGAEAVMATLFVDFGNVWISENTWKLDELRYAAGFGVGLDTPIGPICLDLARPVFDTEHVWQWNISIGYSF